MALLEKLRKLCEIQEFNPIAPSWCIVNYLLLRNEGENKIPMGAVVAASAECSIFSYKREGIDPMYFSTIGGNERLRISSGYLVKGIRTENAEEAFQFIKKGIDMGKGVFVSGPEIAVCYGYEDNSEKKQRKVMGITKWGPGLNGILSWDQFTRFVEMFGNNEGFAFIDRKIRDTDTKDIVEMLAEQVIDWQENHPAVAFGQKQEYYGLVSLRSFLDDLSIPETRETIDEAYINCHAIDFQSGGRYWLGKYLVDLAKEFDKDLCKSLTEVGKFYLESHLKMKQFYEFDILDNKTEKEIIKAIDWLKEALIIEENILGEFKKIQEIVTNKQ